MNNRLKNISYFNKFTKKICRLQKMDTDNFLHSKKRLKHEPKSHKTFIGYNNCGATCYILFKYFKNKNFNIRVIKNTIVYQNILHDHVVLKYDNLIIDPTYRQFLTPNYDNDAINNEDNGIDIYHNYLFDNPMIYIQDKKYIRDFLDDMNEKHNEVYSTDLDKNQYYLAKNLINIDGEDITDKYLNINIDL